ncbi:MAG: hypothetical protein JXB10_05670 [Pirellulales bacterium]|nr:hypothetical protein [Pirellulales bacterium]
MSAELPETVEIACPRCKVRIAVPRTSAGTSRQCPECRTDFLITQKMLGLPRKIDPANVSEDDLQIDLDSSPDDGDEYALAAPPPSPPEEAAFGHREDEDAESSDAVRPEEDLEDQEPTPATWAPTTPPNWGLFVSGLGSFLGNGGIWMRGIPLGFSFFSALWLVGYGLFLGRAPAAGFMSFGAWAGSLILCCFGGIIGLMTLASAAAFAVAVVRDTAEGLDVVESWPSGFIVDWGQELLYVGAALLWGLVPGGIASVLLPQGWRAVAYGFGEAVFFPLLLLAAVDAVTPALPSSTAVWQSPFRRPSVWLMFYALTIPLAIVIAGICLAAFITANFIFCLAAAAVFIFGWMLYFRLLGRLAWYCSGRCEQMEND